MVFTAGSKCWEGYQAHGNLAQCSQKRLVIDFIWYFLQFFLWLQPWLHLDIQVNYFVSSYDKYYENLTKISFWARCSWEQIFKIGIFPILTEVASGFGIFKENRDNPNEIGMVGHSETEHEHLPVHVLEVALCGTWLSVREYPKFITSLQDTEYKGGPIKALVTVCMYCTVCVL